ncbi:MAG: hypothetical protein GF315_13355 [candidate division Zixibacteria bacterium]|nr:hypothetical protein [candidate division Zixibacteria bacterium]
MQQDRILRRPDLDVNFAAIASDFVKDSVTSFSKIKLYPPGHQLIRKFIEQPFSHLEKVLSVKTQLGLELSEGKLWAEGCLLRNDEYVTAFAEAMTRQSLSNLVIDSEITTSDLQFLLSRLFGKGVMGEIFKEECNERNVNSIRINVKDMPRLFHFRGDVHAENSPHFMFSTRIKDILDSNFRAVIFSCLGIWKNDREVFENLCYDVRKRAIELIAPEIVEGLDLKFIISEFRTALDGYKELFTNPDAAFCSGMRKFIDLVAKYHGSSASAIEFKRAFTELGVPSDSREFFEGTSAAKLKAIDTARSISSNVETGRIAIAETEDFTSIVRRLISGNLWNPLKDLLASFTTNIKNGDGKETGQSKQLADELITKVLTESRGDVYVKFLEYLHDWGIENNDIPDVAELIASAIRRLLSMKRYDDAVTLASLYDDNGFNTDFRDAVGSGILDDNVAESFVADFLNSPKREQHTFIQLADYIGNPQLAGKIIAYIAVDEKATRSAALKILTSIGDNAVPALRDLLLNEFASSQHINQGSMPDDDWWHIRNIITVISKSKSLEALDILEKLSEYSDKRVRLEVAKALENLPSERTAKLLELLFHDDEYEVREAAIIASGLTEYENRFNSLKLLIESGTDMWSQAITSIGRIRTEESANWLMRLSEDAEYLKECGYKRKERKKIATVAKQVLNKMGKQPSSKQSLATDY